jgi:hypothetical protein
MCEDGTYVATLYKCMNMLLENVPQNTNNMKAGQLGFI